MLHRDRTLCLSSRDQQGNHSSPNLQRCRAVETARVMGPIHSTGSAKPSDPDEFRRALFKADSRDIKTVRPVCPGYLTHPSVPQYARVTAKGDGGDSIRSSTTMLGKYKVQASLGAP